MRYCQCLGTACISRVRNIKLDSNLFSHTTLGELPYNINDSNPDQDTANFIISQSIGKLSILDDNYAERLVPL